ncbi:hypothetical protein LG276_08820 [Cytobacillus kochii]|uniref:hypothetical protein n=1 Tax=Cytobacillus kochii TaxID=859143 RepID=UPI002480770D|nr:hypothetical protein [Cytobacillus kochii]
MMKIINGKLKTLLGFFIGSLAVSIIFNIIQISLISEVKGKLSTVMDEQSN